MKKSFLLLLLLSKLLFAQAQNVGIGTADPARAKLEVHGAVDRTAALFGGEGTGISLQRSFPAVGFNQYYNNGSRFIGNGFGAVQFFDPASGHLYFDMLGSGTANATSTFLRRAMVITAEGRVTIGSGDYPPATLYVSRGNAFDGTAVFDGTKHRSHFNFGNEENTYIRAGKDGGTVVINDIPNARVAMGGYVGINTTTPAYPLEIRQPGNKGLVLVEPTKLDNWHLFTGASTSEAPLWLFYNQAYRGWFSGTDGAYHSVSDRRLKTNISPLPSVLDRVLRLQPVRYEMISNNRSHRQTMGFIAQEVKTVFPELVDVFTDTTENNAGIRDLHTLNYSAFGVLAVKAIQEQQQLLQALQGEIAELRRELREAKGGR